MNKIFMLVYTSRARQPLEKEFLKDVLSVSGRNNGRDNITGFLVARAGHFLQLLEGPEEKARACFNRIQADPRHESIILQGESLVNARTNAGWNMGLVELDEKKSSAEEMLALFELGREGKKYSSPQPLQAMLKIFAREAKMLEF